MALTWPAEEFLGSVQRAGGSALVSTASGAPHFHAEIHSMTRHQHPDEIGTQCDRSMYWHLTYPLFGYHPIYHTLESLNPHYPTPYVYIYSWIRTTRGQDIGCDQGERQQIYS